MASFGSLKSTIFEREERKQQYQNHIRGLNAYDRHKKFMSDYVSFYGKGTSGKNVFPLKTDLDTLREGYRFIRNEEDEENLSWEQRLVKRYHDKLFKEFCIADMSEYRRGKIGLRWRTENEVISGKGQFICGNRKCNERDGLASYEVNFSYVEAGENKQALVKLVACERCADKLMYKHNKEKEKLLGKEEKDSNKRKRGENIDGDESNVDALGSHQRSRKAKRESTSRNDGSAGTDDSFDEYLEGMFPGHGHHN
ncbi:uncharacterized protein LOC116255695 isoform X2 [Nymphaea colorata]|uniref:uncharacterized protein LOC116255695 isoform X2 n=1 Tax=Nymphaea colorata TaxID=210225 RepID=UPI00129E76C3|nr:uncharacterized protein LOC116255695 isoform X2 [Nymphaea colorata]